MAPPPLTGSFGRPSRAPSFAPALLLVAVLLLPSAAAGASPPASFHGTPNPVQPLVSPAPATVVPPATSASHGPAGGLLREPALLAHAEHLAPHLRPLNVVPFGPGVLPTTHGAPPLPAPPVASGSVATVAPLPGAAPPDLTISGNTTVVVSTNTAIGNLTISNNGTLYIHSSTIRPMLTVNGFVRMSQNALLFVNASDLAINEAYDVEWNIQMTGVSRLAMVYSNLTTNGYQWGAAFEEGANVTIVSSLVGYPSGWLDTTLITGARLTVFASWYSSDVILFDNAVAPSTANFTCANSAGFNVWLNFKSGARANITLPGLQGWRNWTFPGTALVSGVNYSVSIYYSYVQVFAVMLWQGANLTLRDSPDVAISLNLELGTVALAGLTEGAYVKFGLFADLFSLRLLNTTVFTWNIYPFAGGATIDRSQVGEIQVFGTAWATVHNSTLTAHGGYYGNQGTSDFGVFDCLLEGQMVGYSGRTVLQNTTVNSSYVSRVLATGTGLIESLDTVLFPHDTYQALAQGVIEVAWTAHVNLTDSATAAGGAQVSVTWSSNGTVATSGLASVTGQFSAPLIVSVLSASGTVGWAYLSTASRNADGASWPWASLSAPTWTSVGLVPLVASSAPSAGATAVPTSLPTLSITFAFPMNTTATTPAVTLLPSAAVSPAWDGAKQVLTLTLAAALSAGTAYTLSVGTGARTADGIPFGVAVNLAFATAAVLPATPAVLTTTPGNNSVGVAVNRTIIITFSLDMNTSTLDGAFQILPSAPGTLTGSSRSLTFGPSPPLVANTTYSVVIGVSATSAQGVPLANPFSFTFRTAANTSTPGGGTPGTGGAPSGGAPPWSFVALGALLALIAVAAVLLMRRRMRPPPAPPVASPAAIAPPPWSEEPPAPPG